MRNKTYSELILLPTFEERFKYLAIDGRVGQQTFAGSRHLNQHIYRSSDWLTLRDFIIVRDEGLDLGHPDHPIIKEKIIVHHIVPITKEMILNRNPLIFDPENLISTRDRTHRAIHYSDFRILEVDKMIERSPNDTSPWRIK